MGGAKVWAELSSIHFWYPMIAAGYPRISPEHLCSLQHRHKNYCVHIYIIKITVMQEKLQCTQRTYIQIGI